MLIRKENGIERDIKLKLWPIGLLLLIWRISPDFAAILKDVIAISLYWYLSSKIEHSCHDISYRITRSSLRASVKVEMSCHDKPSGAHLGLWHTWLKWRTITF